MNKAYSIEIGGTEYQFSDALNVKILGAVGDGLTNDAEALQSALNVGGTIFIPKGTYLVNSTLFFYSNTTIIMEDGAVLKRNSNNVKCILCSQYYEDTTVYNGQKNVRICGGTFDLGSGFTQGGCGIGFVHCENIFIENVTVKNVNTGYHCIDCGGSRNVTVKDCVFTEHQTNNISGEMLQIDGTGSKSAFPIYSFADDSPCYDGTPTVNMEICGCRFDMNDFSPAIGNHNTWVNYNINIHDNMIYGPGTNKITARGAFAFGLGDNNSNGVDNHTDMVFIHDNIIHNCCNAIHLRVVGGRMFFKNNYLHNVLNVKSGSGAANIITESNIVVNDN